MAARSKTTCRALAGALILAAACSGAPPSPPAGTERPLATPVASASATAPGSPDAKSAADGSQVLSPSDKARRRLVLELPASAAFLSAALPAARPERYASFAEASRIHVGRSHLQQVDLFPGEAMLLAASDDEATVRVYERASSRLVGNHPVAGFKQFETGGVLAWPEGEPRFVVGSGAGLLLHDARTGDLLETLSHEKLDDLRFSPDRQLLVARAARAPQAPSRLFFYVRAGGATAGLRALGSLEFSERIDAWNLSADNRLLATAQYPSCDLVVTDLGTGAEVLHVPGPDFGGDVAFSPDGRWVAMGGQGLLLVDLVNPARRAFYSHLENNIGHVRFSPSGDAVITSSYDGRLRIFRWETSARDGRTALTLSLVQTLRHDARANVYAFVFEANGDGVVSVSGDQTIRTFRAQKPRETERAAAAPRFFLALADWSRRDPEAARPFPPAPAPSMRDGHYHPPLLDRAPRPSSIRPGRYACKVDFMYKLRDCSVDKDSNGHTLLRFGPGNLLELAGVLYDDGPAVRFEGWLVEKSSVVGCEGCEKQPLHAVFRGSGNRYQGLLKFRNYYDPYVPPEPPAADEKIESALDRFPLVLEFRGPSTTTSATR